jgi:hypothetical protein
MTPLEMCVLFSGNVIAFILVWLTNFSERVEAPGDGAAQAEKNACPSVRDKIREGHDYLWDVNTFFGFKGRAPLLED